MKSALVQRYWLQHYIILFVKYSKKLCDWYIMIFQGSFIGTGVIVFLPWPGAYENIVKCIVNQPIINTTICSKTWNVCVFHGMWYILYHWHHFQNQTHLKVNLIGNIIKDKNPQAKNTEFDWIVFCYDIFRGKFDWFE